jgi:hypothetical protein
MPPVGFEPTISAGERPQQTHALDCVATGNGCTILLLYQIYIELFHIDFVLGRKEFTTYSVHVYM